MQENRSFDNYFGTYPGANGIPPNTCVPINPQNTALGCVQAFHNPREYELAGPHASKNAEADLDNGISGAKMDGFVRQQDNNSARVSPIHDVMGYHTADEIPNYWAYAQNFVLQDAMFTAIRSDSGPSHLDMTSEWSAVCSDPKNVATCATTPLPQKVAHNQVAYPWVNLFQLLDMNHVSWKYYLGKGREPDCVAGEMDCPPQNQAGGILSYWNPVPGFAWVAAQGSAYLQQHNPETEQLLADITGGTLPQVSWVVPANNWSEHPPSSPVGGMEYVTAMVNAVMQSPYWMNTAIFISWDDWGGLYDHVVPPNVDRNNTATPIQGFGIRVPGLMISAYAKAGMIDHSVLSADSYATFIEDLFLGGERLDPAALGQPDARPTIRDELTSVTFPDGSTAPIGDLMDEFDFTQTPLPALVLTTHIPAFLAISCGAKAGQLAQFCTTDTVTFSWASLSGPQVKEKFTYSVTRDGTALPACTNISATSCTDQAPSGAHLYRVTSTDRSGVTSPASAAAEADAP
jgi:phospholipase C